MNLKDSMANNQTSEEPAREHAFESEAVQVLSRLRTALTQVVAGVPGNIAKPTELQRALHVDMNLCCKMLKVVAAPGVLDCGLHLPGISAIRMFIKAARKAGINESVVTAATSAADEFDQLVNEHADDRSTFDSMISSLVDDEEAAQLTFKHRRATFRGQRHLFGVQARAQIKCMIVQPSDQDPNLLDLATLTGFVSLRLLRSRVPVVISPAYTIDDDGAFRDVSRDPIDPSIDESDGIALLRDFCSRPDLQLQTVQAGKGRKYVELVGMGVGNKAAVTCVEGDVTRAAVPRYKEPENQIGAHLAEVRIPCETLLLDLLVREDTFGPMKPTAHACADHMAEARTPGVWAPWQRLEPRESVAYLGKSPAVLYSSEYSRYPELGRYALERLGWDGDKFDVYRCRIEYPVLPSTAGMFFDLPEAPQ